MLTTTLRLGLLSAVLLAGCDGGGREVQAFYGSGALRSEGREIRLDDQSWVKSGRFRSWYEGGELESEGAFVHDVASGPWRYWYPDGSLRARGSYLFGEEEGVWVHRRPDGSPDEELTGVYEAGARIDAFHSDGERTEWFEKDRPRERVGYVDGLRHGRALGWYPDGSLRSEGQYVRGRKAGRWVYWREDGSIDTELSGVYEGWRKVAEGEER